MPANDDEMHIYTQACQDFSKDAADPAAHARGGVALLKLSMTARCADVAGRASCFLAEARGHVVLGEALSDEFSALSAPVYRRADFG